MKSVEWIMNSIISVGEIGLILYLIVSAFRFELLLIFAGIQFYILFAFLRPTFANSIIADVFRKILKPKIPEPSPSP